jgi:U3 small nucleolar RNA-associated protein 4
MFLPISPIRMSLFRFVWYRIWTQAPHLLSFYSMFIKGSFGAIVAVDLKEEFPKRCRVFPLVHVRGTKRKRTNSTSEPTNIDEIIKSETSSSCAMCLRYNSMLFMNCVRENEMVVVEQPWLNVVATLPGALQRKVYGT